MMTGNRVRRRDIDPEVIKAVHRSVGKVYDQCIGRTISLSDVLAAMADLNTLMTVLARTLGEQYLHQVRQEQSTAQTIPATRTARRTPRSIRPTRRRPSDGGSARTR